MKKTVENELSNYIEDMIDICTNDFKEFPSFRVVENGRIATTQILSEKVIFDLEYDLTITKEDETYNLKDFGDIEVIVRLGVIYDAIDEFMQDQVAHSDSVCVTCITRIAEEKDLYFRMFDYDSETILFNVRDKNSKVLDEEYVYKFANRY